MRRRILKIPKTRNTVLYSLETTEATKNEMDYLESVIYQNWSSVFNNAFVKSLWLVDTCSALKKGIKQGGAKPHVFYATDGTRILVVKT